MTTIYLSSRVEHPGWLILRRCTRDGKDKKVDEIPRRLQVSLFPVCITWLQEIGLDFARQ